MIPRIKVESVKTLRRESYDIEFIRFESWENVLGTAHLYVSHGNGNRPFTILCCGHGIGGKLNRSYQAIAIRLCRPCSR